jgi:hypothetical protein
MCALSERVSFRTNSNCKVVKRRRAHGVGPPEVRILHDQFRKFSGVNPTSRSSPAERSVTDCSKWIAGLPGREIVPFNVPLTGCAERLRRLAKTVSRAVDSAREQFRIHQRMVDRNAPVTRK